MITYVVPWIHSPYCVSYVIRLDITITERSKERSKSLLKITNLKTAFSTPMLTLSLSWYVIFFHCCNGISSHVRLEWTAMRCNYKHKNMLKSDRLWWRTIFTWRDNGYLGQSSPRSWNYPSIIRFIPLCIFKIKTWRWIQYISTVR